MGQPDAVAVRVVEVGQSSAGAAGAVRARAAAAGIVIGAGDAPAEKKKTCFRAPTLQASAN